PRPAKSPMLPDPERKSAKCADGHEEADDIAEPPPHLKNREGDVAEDGIQPRDDGRHGRLRGIATVAQRFWMRRTWPTAVTPLRTPRQPRRVMPDPDLSIPATAPICEFRTAVAWVKYHNLTKVPCPATPHEPGVAAMIGGLSSSNVRRAAI